MHVGAFPISIDVARFEKMAASRASRARSPRRCASATRPTRQLGVCVDRIDYTKGILERIRALDTLWTESSELREQFTFIFVCTPSRSEVPAYTTLERDVVDAVIVDQRAVRQPRTGRRSC